MARNSQRGSRNNNSEGRNQYNSGWRETARERPVAAAVTAAAAVGAGVFLWSRRNQISEQISNLSDQVGEWAGNMNSGNSQRSGSYGDYEYADSGAGAGAGSSMASGQNSSKGRKGGKASQSSQGAQNFAGTTGSAGTSGGSTVTGTTGGTAGTGGTDF